MPTNAGDVRDMGLMPGSGRSSVGGHDSPLYCSCLEDPMDRVSWQAKVHRVTKSQTPLKQLNTHSTQISTSTLSDKQYSYFLLSYSFPDLSSENDNGMKTQVHVFPFS